MIRSNLLRDQVCVLSCQQVMKQECQSTGESKLGQKEGSRKFAPKGAIALIEACDEISRESLQQPEIAKEKNKTNFVAGALGCKRFCGTESHLKNQVRIKAFFK